MTIKEAKEYLKSYKTLDTKIECLYEERQRIIARGTRITAPTDSFGGGCACDKVGRAATDLAATDAEIYAEIQRLCDLRREISQNIDRLPNTEEQLVLRLRYINNLPFETSYNHITNRLNEGIDRRIGCSSRTVYRLHCCALKNFSEICKLAVNDS